MAETAGVRRGVELALPWREVEEVHCIAGWQVKARRKEVN